MLKRQSTPKDNRLIGIVKQLISDPILRWDKDLVAGLQSILNDFGSHEYRITIIGEFSSGKSTFLNAIIGQDILPHGVEETTAAVTYIHNVNQSDKKYNKAKIIFRNGNNPEVLDLSTSRSALIDYVTAKSKNKDVVKDIEEVHLYVNFMNGGENIVLIDTPGLNGIKDGMRDITYREIMRSHANICLFHIKGISQTDVDFIERFYKDKTPIFFVLNQIDRLTEETPEEKLKGFSNDIRDSILHIKENPKFVFGVSALQALSARDKFIKKVYADDKETLDDDRREYYLEKSGMLTLERALLDFIKNGDMERNYLEHIKSRIINLLEIARNKANQDIEILQAKVSDIPEKVVLESQKNKVLASIQKNLDIIKIKLGAQMTDLERKQKNNIRKICINISEVSNNIVNGWTTLDIAERETKSGRVVNTINNKVNEERERMESRLTPEFDRIYDDLVSIVRSFIPNVSYSKKESKWTFSIEHETVTDNSKLRKINENISEIKKDIEEAEKQKEEIWRERINVEDKIKAKKRTLKDLESDKRAEIRYLGQPPRYRSWTESRPVKKKFLKIFSYNSSESYTVDNSSEINRYREKERRINNEYNSKISSTKSAISSLERTKEKLDPVVYDSMVDTLKKKQALLEKQKKQVEAELELQRKYARTKLLNNLKDNARRLIRQSIEPDSGELYLSLADDMQSNINHAEQKMRRDLESEYERMRNTFISQLERLIKKVEAKEDVENNKKIIEELKCKVLRFSQYLTTI